VPKGLLTKPTTSSLREAIFNICQNIIVNARFLDLYAGSGAIGFEALSRQADSVIFVDSSRNAIHCIHHNAKLLDVENRIKVIPNNVMNALNKLETLNATFDIIYADPPYRKTDAKDLICWIDSHEILVNGGYLFIEEAEDAVPEINNLKSLQLISRRRFGNTVLLQFLKGAKA
jgi:16S rRNA (guanine966-N2)-methyltransferase